MHAPLCRTEMYAPLCRTGMHAPRCRTKAPKVNKDNDQCVKPPHRAERLSHMVKQLALVMTLVDIGELLCMLQHMRVLQVALG